MASAKKEAIVLIVDIRKSKLDKNGSDITFAKVKDCAIKIVSRKVFSRSKDDIALVILGSEKSNNSVDQNLSYDNIEVVRDLECASWNMVEDCYAGLESATDCGGDVLESFVVAMSILRNKRPLSYESQKVVLISHACGSSNPEGLDVILSTLKDMKVQVTVIGPNIAEHSQSQTKAMEVDESLSEWSIVAHIAVETDGLVCRFKDALEQLTNFERKKTRAAPWKVGFEIGPNLTIPVFGLIKVSAADEIKSKIRRVGEDGSLVERDYVFTVQSAMTADEKPVKKEEIVDGYNFGSTIVPFSADEQAVLGYQSGPKSLKLLYFTDSKNVSKYLYVGKGEYYFFPADDMRTKGAFFALVKAMTEENVVAIVRRVYNNNSNPSLGVLSPKIKEKYMCLVYVALPYAEDIKHLSFRPLHTKKSQPSPEQLEAIDQLISNMNLMEVPDEEGELSEAFRLRATLDPCQQRLYEVICDRALNPDRKEIVKPSENVLKMVAPPAEFQERLKPVLDKIKGLFPLEEKKPREGARKAAVDVFKQDTADFKAEEVRSQKPNASSSTTRKIGTLTPVQDFNQMLEENKLPFKEVCGQMQDVIWNCVEHAFDLDDMKKTVSFVQALRAVCIKADPEIYNSWINKLKNDLPSSKMSFLKLLVEENVALITHEDTVLSSVTEEEAKNLLREDAAEPEQTSAGEDDLDDLLNEM